MKSLFYSNSLTVGLVVSLLLNVLTVLVLCLVLWLFKMDILINLKIFIFSVVPNILLLRYYATNELQSSMKGSTISLVVCLAGLLIWLYKMNIFDGAFNWAIRL
ncbi:MAG: hypothetical protein IJ213_03860 [Bacteroidales bacterium]|nr:hypothetical protein [Bacteroidales bacterium]